MKFSNELSSETTTDKSVTEYDLESEASQLSAEIASQMQSVTDEAGSTVYSQEQISEYISMEMTPQTNTTAASGSGNKTGTTAQSGSTTKAAASQNNTTQANNSPSSTTAAPQQQQPASGSTEFDILRSGNFYASGSMTDEAGTNQPLELALTSSSVYMLTKFEGVDMGILQKDGKLYMIYPAKQVYMEMSSVIMGMMGMSSDDLLDISELGFADMKPLSEADAVADAEFNGTACKMYTFNKSSGSRTVVYMNGSKLLGFEDVSSSGTSTTIISSISSNVPADKCSPPSGYKKTNMISFMKEIESIMPSN